MLFGCINLFSQNKEQAEVSDTIPAKEYEEAVFTTVEQMPEFPGGMNALFKYITANLKFPAISDVCVQGRVVLRFVVRKDGSIGDVEVLHSLHPSFDEEAVKVIRGMPRWTPGKQNGKPVAVYFTLPIRFKPSVN